MHTTTSHDTRRSGPASGAPRSWWPPWRWRWSARACGDDDDASSATTTIAPTTAAPTTAAPTTAAPTTAKPTTTGAAMMAGPTTAAPTTTATSTGAGTAAFEDAACPTPNIPGVPSLDFPPTAKCGYLTVPEDRSKPDGRMIRIFVVRFPALSATPKPDPIVVLSGGPGGGGSFEFASWVKQRRQRRARPHPVRPARHPPRRTRCCRARTTTRPSTSAISIPFTSDEQTVKQAAAVKACRDRLTAAGIDVAAYNSRRERRRRRRPAGRARHRGVERLRRLVRLEAGAGRRCVITPRASAAWSSTRCRRPTTRSPRPGGRPRPARSRRSSPHARPSRRAPPPTRTSRPTSSPPSSDSTRHRSWSRPPTTRVSR